jgi:RNA polymerase sigma-70 factor (ECF subfamily)
VEDDVISAATAKAVRECVRDLPRLYRDPIALAYYYGLSYREVAVELGVPEGTAKSRLRSGLHQLAERMAAAGYPPG